MHILQIIMSKGFGTLNKIFLEYEDAWWWEGCEGIQLVWTNDIPAFENTTHRIASANGKKQQVRDNVLFHGSCNVTNCSVIA